MSIHHFGGAFCAAGDCFWLSNILPVFEYIPRVIGLKYFGMEGSATFSPENEERTLGETGFIGR